MTDRLIMNSSNLQKRFPEIYEDFFSKYNLIISCPHVINRWHISHLKWIKRKIAQKLPTKLYVGINIRKDDEIHFQEYIEFNNKDEWFDIKDIEIKKSVNTNIKIKKTIRKILSDFWVEQWIDLMILSENESGRGTASTTVRAFTISIMAHILWGKLLPEEWEKYEDRLSSKWYTSVCSVATDIIAAMRDIDKFDINQTIMFTAAISHGNMCQAFPNISFLEERHPKLFRIGNNACNDHHNPKVMEILDFSIISFWSGFDEFYNRITYKEIQKEYDDIDIHYQIERPNPRIFEDYMNFLYAKITEAGANMMMNTTNDGAFNLFLDQINKVWSQQVFMEDYMNLYRDIISTFKRNKTLENERLGLIPISSGKLWGTFLLISKTQISRNTIKKVVEELRTHEYPTAYMQWASREDGISDEHPKIEQYLDKEIISPYLKENDSLFENGLGKKILGKHRELLKQTEDTIIFDCIDEKIYINNELTNHKEILTQSGTVEIMKVVMENMGRYVNNSKLPVSSYTKNKNEMVGKIIWPLQELIKKRFNEKLNLECTGNIVDFDMKLTPNKINIWLLKKINQ